MRVMSMMKTMRTMRAMRILAQRGMEPAEVGDKGEVATGISIFFVSLPS